MCATAWISAALPSTLARLRCGSSRGATRSGRSGRPAEVVSSAATSGGSSATSAPAAKRAATSAVSASFSATVVEATQRAASACNECDCPAIVRHGIRETRLWREWRGFGHALARDRFVRQRFAPEQCREDEHRRHDLKTQPIDGRITLGPLAGRRQHEQREQERAAEQKEKAEETERRRLLQLRKPHDESQRERDP